MSNPPINNPVDTPLVSVRSIFVSDQHLGFRFSRAQACLDFLRQYQADRLYLVGDFLDGWRLKIRWYWPSVYNELIEHILGMIDQGTQVYYTPGNHDDFLRKPHPAVHGVEFSNEFVHEMADGRRLLVTHGDQFDSVEKKFHRLSKFGSAAYDALTRFNFFTNQVISKVGFGEFNYCFFAKRWSKKIVGKVGGFETVLAEYAQSKNCDGVICGHIHRPEIRELGGGIVYCNTGDWVEHRSAIVESNDGSLTLLDSGAIQSTIECRTPATSISSSSLIDVPTRPSSADPACLP